MSDAGQVKRIQLKRTQGWRMPPNTVKVDRSTCWGNPFRVGDPVSAGNVERPLTAEEAVREYRRWLDGQPTRHTPNRPAPSKELIRAHLRGRNLACWCAQGAPCHAQVLLEIANS